MFSAAATAAPERSQCAFPGNTQLILGNTARDLNREPCAFRQRFELGTDGASGKGMAAGYYDVEQLLFYVSGIGPIHSSGMANCPAIYAAAHELADGYPDPKTGQCTALSSAFNFAVVSAFILHPGQSQAGGNEGGMLERLKSWVGEFFTDARKAQAARRQPAAVRAG